MVRNQSLCGFPLALPSIALGAHVVALVAHVIEHGLEIADPQFEQRGTDVGLCDRGFPPLRLVLLNHPIGRGQANAQIRR